MFDALKQINWLDIFSLIIFVRVLYVAAETGVINELFKLLGTITAICLALHYYSRFAGATLAFLGNKLLGMELFNLPFFIALALLGYWVLVVFRKLFTRLITMEAAPDFNKYGGVFLGILRGILLTSLISCALVGSNIGYLKKSVTGSASAKYIFKVAPATYAFVYNGIISKFVSSPKLNNAILDSEGDIN
ncbi:MAG: CvpA family protein [Candidatus Omnitrophota bacterium]